MSQVNEAIAHLESGKARFRIVLKNWIDPVSPRRDQPHGRVGDGYDPCVVDEPWNPDRG